MRTSCKYCRYAVAGKCTNESSLFCSTEIDLNNDGCYMGDELNWLELQKRKKDEKQG